MTVHASVRTRVGLSAIRDLVPSDIESIVQYWFTSGDEFLDFMGIDLARLGTKEESRQRFLRAIPTGNPDQETLAFAITVDDAFAGYTLLNRYAQDTNYSHWHITNPALRGAGLSSALYPHRIRTYFEAAPINRLTHQTRTRNIAVNRMLDKYVPVAETCYVQKPDGVALPGEFHLRYVYRKDIPELFRKQAIRRTSP
jgi:RimJ/RimL family protein N-acetyltransferase